MRLFRKTSQVQQTGTERLLLVGDKFAPSSLAYQLEKAITSRLDVINVFITKYPPGNEAGNRHFFISTMIPGYEFRTGDNRYKINNNKASYIRCVEIIKKVFPSCFVIDYMGFVRLLCRFNLRCYSPSRFDRRLSNETVDGLKEIWNKLVNEYIPECEKVSEILKTSFPEKCGSSYPLKGSDLLRFKAKIRLIDNINLKETDNPISFIFVTPSEYTDNTVIAVKLLNYGVAILGTWENE